MYVCICHAVRDTDIKKAVDNGAQTVQCLRKCLGVSNQCGKCTRQASRVLEDIRTQEIFRQAV